MRQNPSVFEAWAAATVYGAEGATVPETTNRRERAAALLAGAVAVGDLLQVALLSWRPKHVGALAGALVYACLTLAVARGSRLALWIVAAMPLLPLTVLALAAAGAPLPVAPDAGMVAVLVVQLLAAGAALLSLRRAGPRPWTEADRAHRLGP